MTRKIGILFLSLRDYLECDDKKSSCRWGVAAIEAQNDAKAALLYSEIDANPLFKSVVNPADRSKMNVSFVLNEQYTSLEEEFNAFWGAADLVGLKGHRTTGGYRASLYNALPLESVQVLVDVMKEFAAKKA